MSDKTNIPKLRFKDKDGNNYPKWMPKRLGDIGKIAMNKRIYKNETSEYGEIPFYKIGNFGKEADTFITRKKFNEYKEKYPYPKKGDILISASGSIGKTLEYDGEEAYYQDSNIVWLEHDEQVINKFLKYFYAIVKWNGVEGTTIKRLYNKNILSTKINLPIVEEQEKIGHFFSKLDRQIELEEEKLELLEQQKKGYMQKIFSQQLKFKDENGQYYIIWEAEKLGELTNITTGSLDANAMVPNGKYKFFTCARETYEIDTYAFDTEALLISGNGANVGYIHYYQGKFNAYQRTYVLNNFKANITYLKYYLEKYLLRRIYSEKRDGNTPYITRSTLYDMEIMIPSLEEQEKIGNFFNKIDNLIELQVDKIEVLKQRKKGLLQKMFV
ncbi:restriction endonuclease subunit S [Staphylococcus warneri]|nr:restriction endonuclease subunit S [Staphylococcus warneri]MCT2597079.1 restriction endonuclease subunit S [Staphylococcus warneri]